MPPVTKPGVTCHSRGARHVDKGTNCISASPLAGVAGLAQELWNDAVSFEHAIADDFGFIAARFFGADKAASYAEVHAHARPFGKCARYSTAAITAGFGVPEVKITPLLGMDGASASYAQFLVQRLGLKAIIAPEYAKNYGIAVLTPLGFTVVAMLEANNERKGIELPKGYSPNVGDVIIFPENDVANSEAGHMQICTGDEDIAPNGRWASDGHQLTILPTSDLTKGWHRVGFSVYRFGLAHLLSKPIVKKQT